MQILDIVYIDHLRDPQLLNWHSRVHDHGENEFELHYFIGGSGKFKLGNDVYGIEKGELFLCLPHQVHAIQPEAGGEALTYYAILFEFVPHRDSPQLQLMDRSILSHFPAKIGPNWRLRFEEMKNRYNSGNEYYRAATRFNLMAFLFDLVARSQDQGGGAAKPQREPSGDIFVEQAMELFQRRIRDQVQLSEIAAQLHITEEYLIKLFKRRLGITPMQWYRKLKQEAASSLLLNSTLSIKEISWQLGFSSQYHFSRSFKEFSGQSPSEYRERYFRNNPTKYQLKIV